MHVRTITLTLTVLVAMLASGPQAAVAQTDGKIEVRLQGLNVAQYFGVARADLYLRAREASFAANLIKGYIGIWLQMVLVIAIGVMFSTFLSGPIAAIATLGALVGGMFQKFMSELAGADVTGGGPAEAFFRLITQRNVVSKLEPGLTKDVIEMFDRVFEQGLLRGASSILPDFRSFNYADYVAHGFDISPNLLFQSVFQAIAFLLPVFVAGYFFFKTREVAK